jgi:hypothetical protein
MGNLNERLAWLAGIIDGEGCVSYRKVQEYHTRDKKMYERVRWSIRIANTDSGILDACSEVFEELGVHHTRYDDARTTRTGKLVYNLCVHRLRDVLRVAVAIEPYVQSKKRATIERMLSELPTRKYQEKKWAT